MTLAGCNLLDDSNGLCAAFHGTVDDLLFGELAHGGSPCTPSAEGKGSIASTMSRTVISHQRQRGRRRRRRRRKYTLGKMDCSPADGRFGGRACLRFPLLLAHEARFGRPMTRALCRLICQPFSYALFSRSSIPLLLRCRVGAPLVNRSRGEPPRTSLGSLRGSMSHTSAQDLE